MKRTTEARSHGVRTISPCLRVSVVCVLILAIACGREQPRSEVTLEPVSLPDLSRLSPAVGEQLRERHAAMTRVVDSPNATTADRARAYGEAGMTLMAAEYASEAEAAFANAEALAPAEIRWPYYRGHLHREAGRAEDAAAAFERALEADASYVPAQIWLANAYLDQGRPEQAEPLFSKALTSRPHMPAAHFGLGRAALARRDFATAVRHLEQVLAIDPAADGAHYPLALAYRGLGDEARAQTHAQARGVSGEVLPPDPLTGDVEVLFESAVAYEVRGARAMDEGKWLDAAEQFRRGSEMSPDAPSLRHKYGTALAMTGDMAAARRAFEETIRRSPGFAKAHYSLGVVKAGAGDIAGAERAWQDALRAEPNYLEPRLQLAHALRRTGRAAPSLPHYARVLEIDPRVEDARYGLSMALVMLGRHAEARDRLAEAVDIHRDRPAFAVALARVLAAAPDSKVRDGARALTIVDAVPEGRRSIEWAEVRAMALAEAGRFDEAAALQQDVIAAAEQAGFADAARAMRQTLARYRNRQPLRTPWRPDEPMELPEAR